MPTAPLPDSSPVLHRQISGVAKLHDGFAVSPDILWQYLSVGTFRCSGGLGNFLWVKCSQEGNTQDWERSLK